MYTRVREFYSGHGRAGMLVRAVVGSAGLRVVGMGLGFLVGVQLARMLGPAGYGIYGIAMSLVSLAMIPTELGLSQLVTRESAMAEAAGNRSMILALLRWSFRFVLVNAVSIAILVLIVSLLFGQTMDPDLRSTLIWGLALLPLVAIASIASAALRGIHRVMRGQLAELLLRPGLLSISLFLFWLLKKDHALTPATAMCMNAVVAAIAAALVLRWVWPLLKGSVVPQPLQVAKAWLRSTIPLALGEGMRVVSGNLAILMLGLLAPAQEVGIYRVAAGVYTAASLPSALLNVACSPMLARLHAEGNKAAIQRMNAWMALILFVAAAGCLILFALVGDDILSIAFGSSYAPANAILIVLLLGELVAAFMGHPTVLLNMLHRERAVTRFSLVALLVNIFISYFMIRAWGAIGAAIGVAVSQFVWRFLCAQYAKRELGLESSMLAWRRT